MFLWLKIKLKYDMTGITCAHVHREGGRDRDRDRDCSDLNVMGLLQRMTRYVQTAYLNIYFFHLNLVFLIQLIWTTVSF